MPEKNDTLRMPDGGTVRIVRSPAETAGELIEIELTVPPGSPAIPKHRHPVQEEEYEVLAGTFDILYEGEWRTLREGEGMRVPRGAVHAFRGASEAARVRNVHRPALDFDRYLETLYGLGESGKIKKLKSLKTLTYLSMLWEAHPQTIVAVGPLRGVMWLLARVGRLLGYRLESSSAGRA